MGHAPFVRRAPELAEEILAKVASLPKDLQTFSRDLLTKEAAQEPVEKLVLPKKLTLEDLAKTAQEKRVDLPKVGPVSSEDFAKIAQDLRSVVAHQEAATEEEILAAAVTILEKQAKKDSEHPVLESAGAGAMSGSWRGGVIGGIWNAPYREATAKAKVLAALKSVGKGTLIGAGVGALAAGGISALKGKSLVEKSSSDKEATQ